MTPSREFTFFTYLPASEKKIFVPMLARMTREAEAGSEFEQKTRDLHDLSDDLLCANLIKRGYDCVIASESGTFVGLIALQKHPSSWHTFYWYVPPEYEHRGIATEMLGYLLTFASYHRIPSVRTWAEGQNRNYTITEENAEKMRRLNRRALENRLDLPIQISAGKEPGYLILGAISS
ncbi:MAG: GNAT family N-acetyltransferase [Candidatus Kaiserbacteria bacterium]|nr:GNAT family N-acetyltransferase [Candidatus Kaiserbacteria bacterium]